MNTQPTGAKVAKYDRRRKTAGTGRVLVDIILIFLTGGLWLLWMLVRFLRSNTG